MTPLSIANLFLLIIALFLVIVAVVPKQETCWLPPSAPSRGIYAACWTFDEVVR